MKILMFGWEFPPHITGGLGTACYGLTKGLSEVDGISVTFVVPRVWGDEDQPAITLVGANQVPVRQKRIVFAGTGQEMEYVEVSSKIIPYVGPDAFWALKNGRIEKGSQFVEVTETGTINFRGGYGTSLYDEIKNYALVAGIIARQHPCDLIHAHDWLAFPAGIAAKKETGRPLVIHVHATDFDRSGGEVNPMVYSMEREGMEAADRIITVSNLTRNTVIGKYHIDPAKVVTVYNAVEPLPEAEKEAVKRGFSAPVVTFLGRITYQKGPEYFLEAAALVLKKTENVHFVMAGIGDMTEAMIEHAARLGISDRFHFTGFLMGDEVQDMLRISNVVVMPSVSEPFGIVPLEAMQAGIPVIISRQSGVGEIVHYTLKVDFWDTFALADAIYGLLNYPVLSRLFSDHGISETSGLKWKNAAAEVAGIYREVIKENVESKG